MTLAQFSKLLIDAGYARRSLNLECDVRAALRHHSRPFLPTAAREPMDRTDQSRARRRTVPELEREDPERVLYRQRARPHHGRARGPYSQQLRRAQLRLRPYSD